LNPSDTTSSELIPVSKYIEGSFVPLSHLACGWELHSAIPLSPAEERTMVREPAQALPSRIVERVGAVRVLIVPFIACLESGDAVAYSKPEGEKHSAVWIEQGGKTHLILAGRDLDPHDTGFELLATVAELARVHLMADELTRFSRMLEDELRRKVPGEIDEEALIAKRQLSGSRNSRHHDRASFTHYRDVSFVSTLAEYVHGLWHDVQIQVGSDHLPVPELRRRMILLAEMFPPNPGYQVFHDGLEN
jgi:hypothetical protein